MSWFLLRFEVADVMVAQTSEKTFKLSLGIAISGFTWVWLKRVNQLSDRFYFLILSLLS